MCGLWPKCLGKPKKKKKLPFRLHDNEVRVLTLEDFISSSPHLKKSTKASTNKRDVSRIVAVFPSPDEEPESDQIVEMVGGDDPTVVDERIVEIAPKRVRFMLPALGDIILVDSTRR